MRSIPSLTGLILVLTLFQMSWQAAPTGFGSEGFVGEDSRESIMKRHSEGTFSNDYSKYLEDRKAQDFVQWLMNNKRSGAAEKRHADGTFTSDVSSHKEDKAIKEFVEKLKSGQVWSQVRRV